MISNIIVSLRFSSLLLLIACHAEISELRPGGSGTIDGNGGGGYQAHVMTPQDLGLAPEPVFAAIEAVASSDPQLKPVADWVFLLRRDLGTERLDWRKYVLGTEIRRCNDYGTEVSAFYRPAANGPIATIEFCAMLFSKPANEQLAIVLHELSHHAIQIIRGKVNVSAFYPANDGLRDMSEEELLVHRLEALYAAIIVKLALSQDIAGEVRAINIEVRRVLGQLPASADLGPTPPNSQIRRVFAGSTIDACDRGQVIVIEGKSLAANETIEVDLASEVREVHWQCGSVTERSASNDAFNSLIASRSDTGAMLLNFYRKTVVVPPPPPSLPPVFVGDTYDGCDRDEVVNFEGLGFGANESRTFDLVSMVDEIFWYCGGSRERSANGRAFNQVIISRSDTGRLHLRFFIQQ